MQDTVFTQTKLRATKQRRIILDELRKQHTHPTADELYEIVRQKLPKVSLGTVYRNLELLAEAGLIQKLQFAEDAQKHFDGNPDPHAHIYCQHCGRVEDIFSAPDLSEYLNKIETSFKIKGYNLIFYGICPNCLKHNSN